MDWGVRFLARPVVGGHFALLALEAADAANERKRSVEAEEPFVVQGETRDMKWEKEV